MENYTHFTMSNSFLAMIEFVAVSGDAYKYINYNIIEEKLIKEYGLKPKFFETIIEVIEKVSASNTVRLFFQSVVYQKLYHSKEISNYFERSIICNDSNQECPELEHLIDRLSDTLTKSQEIKDLFSPLKENKKEFEQLNDAWLSLSSYIANEDTEMLKSLFYVLNNFGELYPEEVVDLIKRRGSDFIKFKFLNKKFKLNFQDFSANNLRQFYLKYDIFDKNTVDGFINKLFDFYENLLLADININSRGLMLLFWFHSKSLALSYSHYLNQRRDNTMFYQAMVARDSRYADVTLDMLFYYLSNLDDILFQFTMEFKDFEMFWNSFVDFLQREDLQDELSISESKLEDIKNIADNSADSKSAEKIQKEELVDDKYIFATLLHYKAEVENKSFPEICREAAERYVDNDAKDFTGQSMENLFKSMKDQYGLKELRKRAGILKYF